MHSLLRGLIIVLAVAGVGLVSEPGQPQESAQEEILNNFYPYREGFPTLGDLELGLKVDSTNAQVVSSVLPPELLTYLSAGDFSFTIQQTTDFPTRQAFIDATLAHHRGVVVGREELQNYVAGRPFPVLDASDPDAGLKAMWNFRYRDQADDVQSRATMDLVSGEVAHRLRIQRKGGMYARKSRAMADPYTRHEIRLGVVRFPFTRTLGGAWRGECRGREELRSAPTVA